MRAALRGEQGSGNLVIKGGESGMIQNMKIIWKIKKRKGKEILFAKIK